MFFGEKIIVSYLTICDTHVDSSEEQHSCYQSECFIKWTSALSRVCSQGGIEENDVLLSFSFLSCLGPSFAAVQEGRYAEFTGREHLRCTFCAILS